MAENFNLIWGSNASQTTVWNDSDYQRGWETVGDTPPTAQQFDALQRRNDLKAQELNNTIAPIAEANDANNRKPQTVYKVGDMQYDNQLPTGWYLLCTVGGTSGDGDITFPTPLVEDASVLDGDVVWRLHKLSTSVANIDSLEKSLAESTGYGIVSGCEPSISGLTVTVAAGVVHLAGGTRKEISATTVTLDAADSTNPRIDLVYIDSTGVVAKITGTAVASPSVPVLPTGGISVAQVSVAAGASTGTITDKRDMLPRFYNTGIVNVKDFGAVGDGVHDDTQAIQAAIDHGGLVIMPEGIYRVSDGLIVDVNKTTFRGVSSRAIITPLSTFPEDGTMITFCKKVNNDFLGRKYRTQTHGNFSLIGTMEDYPSVTPNITAMKVAGNVGSTYEGHTDCQQYENIVFGWVQNGLNYGAHNYKCIFSNLVFNNGIGNYSLFSDANQNDSGEANVCIGCAFWSGRLKLRYPMNFVSCTIHLAKDTENEPYGHYFAAQQFNFTDCHFEILNHDVNAVYKNCFYASAAIVNFTDCEFICSDTKLIIDEAFFNAPWSTGAPSQINVTGAHAKYMFGKIRPNSATTTLCKGNVTIDKTAWAFSYDGTSEIRMPIHGKSLFTDRDGYVKLGGLANFTITTEQSGNGVKITMAGAYDSTTYRMLGKKIYVGSHKAVSIYCKTTLHTTGIVTQFQVTPNTAGQYGIMFIGNGINLPVQGIANIYETKTSAQDGDYLEIKHTLPIPPGTDYIIYGPAFNTISTNLVVDVECYAELL